MPGGEPWPDWHDLLERMPALSAVVDSRLRHRFANSLYRQMVGVEADEIIGGKIEDVLDDCACEGMGGALRRALVGERVTCEATIAFPGGESRHVEATLMPTTLPDGEAGVHFFAIDIDDRHAVEQELRLSEQRFRLMTESVDGGGWDFDLPSGEFYRNASWRETFGYREPIGRIRDFTQLIHSDDRARVVAAFRDHIAGFTPSYHAEYRLRHGQDDRWVHCSDVGEVVERDADGKPLRVVGIITDITRQRRAQEELRESEEDHRATLQSIGDAVISCGTDGQIVRMNPSAERFTGWTLDQARGRPLAEVLTVVDPTSDDPLPSAVLVALSRSDGDHNIREARVVARDRSTRLVTESIAPITRDGTTHGVVTVLHDVTHDRHFQEQLRISEKMQAIGQLSAGIAHDFNNMLGAIGAAAEIIALRGADDDPVARESLDVILQATERGSALTAKLIGFARPGESGRERIAMHTLIDETADVLRRTSEPSIAIDWQPGAERHMVEGDAPELQSAILNLGINAMQSMPDGGTVTIRTESRVLDEEHCRKSRFDLTPGLHLAIEVIDQGRGIKPGEMERLFDPFFTTLPPGKGSGLGLSVVFGTLRDHNGAVEVASEAGVGSTFTLLLPCAADDHPPEAVTHEPPRDEGSRHVLLVDDEDPILITGRFALEELGYTVSTAVDGADALRTFRRLGDAVDIVIMDMNMPVMHGAEALKALRELSAEVALVVATGYASGTDMAGLSQLGIAGVLAKPYRVATLDAVLSSIRTPDRV